MHQLQKGLQPAHDSERRRCIELRTRRANLKRVRFILTEFLYGFTCVLRVNDQLGLSCIRHLHVQRRHAGLAAEVIQEALNRPLQLHIGGTADSNRERSIDDKLASFKLHLGRHRHET